MEAKNKRSKLKRLRLPRELLKEIAISIPIKNCNVLHDLGEFGLTKGESPAAVSVEFAWQVEQPKMEPIKFLFKSLAQKAGFELNMKDGNPLTLYICNLDSEVTETFIETHFGKFGVVNKVEMFNDTTTSYTYAFVEFSDHYAAARALQASNGELVLGKAMEVGFLEKPQPKLDTSRHFHVFVGDLSPEINTKSLKDAFLPHGDVSDAKVLRDPATLVSKGYGFVSFPTLQGMRDAIANMDGRKLGRWNIRVVRGCLYSTDAPLDSYVFIKNVPTNTSEEEISEAFGTFGTILDLHLFKTQHQQQGQQAFVRYESKDLAERVIAEMDGKMFRGQTVRCASKAEELDSSVDTSLNSSGGTSAAGGNSGGETATRADAAAIPYNNKNIQAAPASLYYGTSSTGAFPAGVPQLPLPSNAYVPQPYWNNTYYHQPHNQQQNPQQVQTSSSTSSTHAMGGYPPSASSSHNYWPSQQYQQQNYSNQS